MSFSRYASISVVEVEIRICKSHLLMLMVVGAFMSLKLIHAAIAFLA